MDDVWGFRFVIILEDKMLTTAFISFKNGKSYQVNLLEHVTYHRKCRVVRSEYHSVV